MEKRDVSVATHTWKFFRAGGFDQVRLDSGADLASLATLDQKLWVALACPVDNVYFDKKTLALIDTDNDRRVRAPELIRAVQWAVSLLKNPDDLVGGSREFSVMSISEASDEGKALIASARKAMIALGKQETDTVTVADIESLESVLSKKLFNGDGIITENAGADEALRAIIREIMVGLGSSLDRSGDPGITREMVETFFKQADDYASWFEESVLHKEVFPFGNSTEEATGAYEVVWAKIDDFFARTAVAGFDERSISSLNGGANAYDALGLLNPVSLDNSEIVNLPLAKILPGASLPLACGLNPSWREKIARFFAEVIIPLYREKESLTADEWLNIKRTFAPWFAWKKRKPTTLFDGAGRERVGILQKSDIREKLLALIEQDLAEAPTFASLKGLEKLVRFHRDLHCLCTNFVNFRDFYAKAGESIFKVGTLYLDQRSCNLCIKVDDPGKHSLMAGLAGTYLVYCECRRRSPGEEKINIVAVFSNGDSDNLMVGRNGVFYDRSGADWDATITKIIENPISFRQAFWQPYKSLVKMIESQVAKRASAADTQSNSKLEVMATTTANADKSKPPEPPKKLDIGVVAALGVAAGALGTFVATLLGYTAGLIQFGPFAIIGAFIGLLLIISGPSLILAFIKLRKRNLGPILDAGGWAINAKARINVPFGESLTHIATLPPGSARNLHDPYAEKKSWWPRIIAFAVLLYIAFAALDKLGYVNEWTGGRLGVRKAAKVMNDTSGQIRNSDEPILTK